MERWRARLGWHDAAAIFVGRLTPLVRIYVTLASALVRVRLRDFLLGSGLAALVWSGGPLALGYVFHDDVARLAGSPLVIEAVVLAAPLIAGVAALARWVWRAETIAIGLRRGRVVAGGAGALFVAGWVVKTARANEWAHEHHLAALDLTVLAWWLTVLAALAVAAIVVPVVELRAAHAQPPGVMVAVRSTLIWVGAMGAATAIMGGIELLYPAL